MHIPNDIYNLILSNISFIEDINNLLHVSKNIRRLTQNSITVIIGDRADVVKRCKAHTKGDKKCKAYTNRLAALAWIGQFPKLKFYSGSIYVDELVSCWSIVDSLDSSKQSIKYLGTYINEYREATARCKHVEFCNFKFNSGITTIILKREHRSTVRLTYNYSVNSQKKILSVLAGIILELRKFDISVETLEIKISKFKESHIPSVYDPDCQYKSIFRCIETIIIHPCDEAPWKYIIPDYLHPNLKHISFTDGRLRYISNLHQVIIVNCPEIRYTAMR